MPRALAPGQAGAPSITMQPDGRWRGRQRVKPAFGPAKRLDIRGSSKAEVASRLDAAAQQVRTCQGAVVTFADGTMSGKDKFEVAAEVWLRERERKLARGDGSPATLDKYQKVLEQHVLPYLGARRLDGLDPQACLDFVATLEASGRTANQVGYAAMVASMVFKHAKTLGVITSNPAEIISLPKTMPPKAEALSAKELAEVLKVVRDHERADGPGLRNGHVALLVDLLLGTGLRISEACVLLEGDFVSLAEGFAVRVNKHHVDVAKKNGIVMPGRKGDPLADIHILLPKFAADRVREHLTGNPDRHIFAKRGVDDNGNTGHRNPDSLRKSLNDALAGKQKIHPHLLRRTVATALKRSGRDTEQIGLLLGHTYPGRNTVTNLSYVEADKVAPDARKPLEKFYRKADRLGRLDKAVEGGDKDGKRQK